MSNFIRRKQQTRDFTVLPNTIFRTEMTLQAIGLLCYLLHLPGDWKVRKTVLHKHFKNGRDATIKAFDELIEFGYIEVIEQRSQLGKFSGNDYLVSDEPAKLPFTDFQEMDKKQPFPEKPFTENPFTEKPFTDNQELINNISNKNDNTNLSTNTNVLVVADPDSDKSDSEGKEKSSAKKEKTLYSQFIDAYYIFYFDAHGVPPKIDGGSGNAAKSMIAYLKTIARNKDQSLKDDEKRTELEVVKMIDFIFLNWSLVRPFLREQYDLKQINGNLNNIMADIKKVPADQRKIKDTADAFIYFKNYYNG